jgi:alkylhydroperoxidase/carboxymuconolactone decarboxylase family protein YurZ
MSRKPPNAYSDFVAIYPKLGEAWEKARDQEKDGPLDEKTRRLVKLGIAVGCMRKGAVSSAARKARGAGASQDEIRQVVALAASTLGFPSTVAVFTWIEEG